MNLEITGKLLEKYDTQVVSERFRKREFVLELPDDSGQGYINYAKMQLVQSKVDIIDRFNIGDDLRVSFNVKGSRYERDGKTNYFSNLDAWRIEMANSNAGGNNGNSQGGFNQGGNNNNNNNNQGGNNYSQGNTQQGGGGNNYGNNNFGGGGGNTNTNGNNPVPSAFSGNTGNNNAGNGSSDSSGDDLPF